MSDTVDIQGVELAKVGTWKGGDGRGRPTDLDITREDLAAAVEAYEYALAEGGAATAEVPIKLGHTMAAEIFGTLATDPASDGLPAFGWVGNLRLKGDTLVGDYLRVPAKLAGMMKSGAWRNRSIEFYRNAKWPLTAGGKNFRMVMSAVAVLGATPPAVKGLADVFAAAAGDDAGERFYLASADDKPLTDAELNKMLDKLTALAGELEPYFRGRAGAPMARTLFASWASQLRRVARVQTQEAEMRAAVLAMLGQPEDATNEAALAALPTIDADARGGLFTLALNAEAGVAVMAEILGMPGASVDDVIAKVRELTGGEPAADTEGGDPAATPPGGGMMSEKTNPEIVALRREVAEAKAEAAKATARLNAQAIAERVKADISAHKLPATVAGTLAALAEGGHDDLYQSVLESTAKVPTGEKGTAAGNEAADEPNAEALASAMTMGLSRDAAYELLTGRPVKTEA